MEGHQFYWQFDYPNGARSINDLYVPVSQVVDLTVVSSDVIHSWWIPELGGKIQAIPGRTNHIWFKADKQGTYTGQCAELCGLYHAKMKARVIVGTSADYTQFVSTTATTDLGRAEFQGACATCHGMQGQGGYGPNLANNPLLTQPTALDGDRPQRPQPHAGGRRHLDEAADAGARAIREGARLQGSGDEWRLGPKRSIR